MTVAGLPLHPLVVHLAVVLVPLAALALIATGWRESWRRVAALPVAVTAVVGATGAFLASQSGDSLQESMEAIARSAGTRVRFGDHPDYGQVAGILAMLFAVAAVGAWALPWWERTHRVPTWFDRALYVIGVVLAVGAIVTMTIAGDTGARLVWQDVGTFAPR
jgi:uncharacterized membrane protein